jgi:hypothetical protein
MFKLYGLTATMLQLRHVMTNRNKQHQLHSQ